MNKKYEITTGKVNNHGVKASTMTFHSYGTEGNRYGAAKFEVSVVAGGANEKDAILSLHHQLQEIREEITNAIAELREKIDL